MVNNLSSFFSPQELDEVLTTTREKGMLLFMITPFKDKETEKNISSNFFQKAAYRYSACSIAETNHA